MAALIPERAGLFLPQRHLLRDNVNSRITYSHPAFVHLAAAPSPRQMVLFQLLGLGFLAAFAEAQALVPCNASTSLFTVASSEDAATLASSLRCLDGDFAVQWIVEVEVAETIRVANGTSLNVTGDGLGAARMDITGRSCSL